MTDTGNKRQWFSRAIILAAIAVMGLAVWFGAQAQRNAGDEGARHRVEANRLLTARLDMETGVRGFLLSGNDEFLEPYQQGLEDYAAAMDNSREHEHPELRGLQDEQDEQTNRWVHLAETAIAAKRDERAPSKAALGTRKRQMDDFRAVNAEYVDAVNGLADEHESTAQRTLVWVIIGLGLAGLLLGYVVVDRPAAKARRRRQQQAEFGELLQFAASEREAQALVGRQLERSAPGSNATVLAINNSENRLKPATDLPEGSALEGKLRTAVPGSCLSIRQGKPFRRREGSERLVDCDLCGAARGSAVCMPALVGGEIIGSVLVTRPEGEFKEGQTRRLEETVSQAAPVLGNLRNLAIAETRAVTDALTGLANSRAAAETLGVMAAFASRTTQPLSAVLVDLDHFKRINDNYGHQVGDEVLAAVGAMLKSELRASDFIARYGGEEFLVLLQATPKESAGQVAEKMRQAMRRVTVSGFTSRVTASFGVASIPDDAGDADGVLRAADEALYAAKDAGRDTVVMHGAPAAQGANGRSSRPADVSSIAPKAAGEAQ